MAPKDGWMDEEIEEEGVRVNWTSSLSPQSNVNVRAYCAGVFHGNRSDLETLDLKVSDRIKASLATLMKIRHVLSPVLSNETCSIRKCIMERGVGNNGLICIWMQGKAGCAGNAERAFALSKLLCVISHRLCKAILDMEIEQKKTAERGFVPNLNLTVSENILFPFGNAIKVAWITVWFLFSSHLTLSIHSSLHYTSF